MAQENAENLLNKSRLAKMSIVKAFLSHSSKDKEFVRAVAQELGRQHCLFDEQAFETGTEFKQSIQNGLDSSSIFVLFANKNSLSSDWVNFEIEEAWYKKLERNLQKSLVYVITDSIDVDQLPAWLKRAKVRHGSVPKVIAREIRTHLDHLMEERKNPFVGRAEDTQALQEALTPADVAFPPHVFFVTGLTGIGRRSLIKNVVEDSLGLKPLTSPFRLGEGSSIQDICSDIANQIEPYNTDVRFQEIMKEIQALPKEDALKRTLSNLRRMTSNGELPIFLDEGGLFDNDGNISEPIQSIIQEISQNDEAYIAFVSSRRPFTDEQKIAKVRVSPLRLEDQKLLIRTLDTRSIRASSSREGSLTSSEVSELATYSAGYPPSAYAAMGLVEEYGIEAVLADKSRFTELRIDQFLKYFSKESISQDEKQILCLLASYSPLPLTVISSTLFSKDVGSASKSMMRLADLSFVVVESRFYRISDPIEDASIKAFGLPKPKVIQALATSIIELINDVNYADKRLDLHRILYRASWYLKDSKLEQEIIFLFNDLIKTIKSLYHSSNDPKSYSRVIEVTEVALNRCKGKSDYDIVHTFRAKAFIHLQEWEKARSEIEILKEYTPLRNIYYLEGFLNRKQRNNQEAIDFYLESRKCGRNDESLNRELGQCYLHVGDYDQANYYAKEVLQRQQDKKRVNFYALDLQYQIAMALNDKETARKTINQLQDIDESAFYYKKSKFEQKFGDRQKAEKFAEEAKAKDKKLRFETLTNLVFCKIINDKTGDAERELNEIDRRFGATHLDVRRGLRARIAIARKRYEDAFRLSDEIRDKTSKPYKTIRRDALKGYLENCAMADNDRTRHELEFRSLTIELGSIEGVEMVPEIDSYFDLN